MTRYTNVKVNISDGQKEKLQLTVQAGCSAVSIRLGHEDLEGDDILAVTDSQARKLADALEKNIQDNLLSERTGEQQLQTDLSKIFNPITETQKTTKREITEGLRPIKEGIENTPHIITFPVYPSIQTPEGEDTQYIGAVAEKYLRKFATKSEADTTYELYDRNGNFYIGNKPVVIIDNNIVVDDEEHEGTPGLWELIVSKTPDDNVYTYEDYDNYARLILKTNTLHRDNIPDSNYPKSSKGQKWKRLLKTISDNRREYEGKGVVVIPSDPNALLERLELLLTSQEAGHTGVGNELVCICDELKRQGVLDPKSYKKLISIIKI